MILTPEQHDTFVARRFDALQQTFPDSVEFEDFRLKSILSACPTLVGSRVLDLGCGKGRFARRMIELGADVVGVDPSQSMLLAGRGLSRVRGTGRRLPFGAGVFNLAIAVEVIQHVGSPNAVLSEMNRVLKPGGLLLILDRNARALDATRPWLPGVVLKWIDESRGLWMYPRGYPVEERWFSPNRLSDEIKRWFPSVEVRFPLSPMEEKRSLFRCVPHVRNFALWIARKGGTDHGH